LFVAVQHRHYIQAMKSDQTLKESTMSIRNFLARITRIRRPLCAETISYDAIFRGEAAAPTAMAGSMANFLPGLRPVKNDVDVYFKDVFAGPVF
jgi:hypothetical protein